MRAVIGVGANLGARAATIERALAHVARLPGVVVVARSSLYETAPVGGPAQPSFLNGAVVVELGARWTPRALVDALVDVERALGRVRGERNGPRMIDLDLLWLDGIVSDDAQAIVPHPRLHERAFALAPLIEVAADARDARGVLYADHLRALGAAGIAKVG